MYNFQIPVPGVVYFDPRLTDVISFGAWKFATESTIFIRQIQRCIEEDMKQWGKSIFLKIAPAFQRKMSTKYIFRYLEFFCFLTLGKYMYQMSFFGIFSIFRIQTPQGFLQGFVEVLCHCTCGNYIRSIFTKLKLLTLEPQVSKYFRQLVLMKKILRYHCSLQESFNLDPFRGTNW